MAHNKGDIWEDAELWRVCWAENHFSGYDFLIWVLLEVCSSRKVCVNVRLYPSVAPLPGKRVEVFDF